MDAARFDALVQSLTRLSTRRAAVTLSISGVLALLGLSATDAKNKKKKKKKSCKKKKCGPCRVCKKGKCLIKTCPAGELCLANGSCGKTCTDDIQCPGQTCTCNEEGGDPVCRDSISQAGCMSLSECESTADCPQGSFCSSFCNPSKCIGLCDNSGL